MWLGDSDSSAQFLLSKSLQPNVFFPSKSKCALKKGFLQRGLSSFHNKPAIFFAIMTFFKVVLP